MPNEKVIFLGNGKEALEQGKSVNWQYDCFGMRYGWLGNRCVITANPKEISLKEQSAFAEYYNSKIEIYKSQIEEFRSSLELQGIHFSETKNIDISEMDEKFKLKWKGTDAVYDKAMKTAVATVLDVPIMLVKGFKGLIDTFGNIQPTVERKNLWKHQYELLVCEFMVNGLQRFMDNTVEKGEEGTIIVYDVKDSEYAHLLHNLIQQYSGYDVAEYTEEMYLDNAKSFSSENKIIFWGNTDASKERWLDIDKYIYNEYGMHYGWNGKHAFINVSAIERGKEDFL